MSLNLFPQRRDVWQIDAYRQCEARRLPDGSVQFVEKAINREPLTWRGTYGGSIEIDVGGGVKEELEIDAQKGPMMLCKDGTYTPFASLTAWSEMSAADQKVVAFKVAKRNKALRPEVMHKIAALKEEKKVREFIHKFSAMQPQERSKWRCEREQERNPVRWAPIRAEQVQFGHDKVSEGILFGMEFPWNEERLAEFGPAWLTKAFRAAGTLNLDNSVTEIKLDPVKIDAGNNAGKFLFEVSYAKHEPDLHTKLFAKVPFPMTKESMSDRLSSSVMKQPMDFMEINTYRLLESSFPMKIPKFYFGDISNTTSNFILITERVAFAEIDGFQDASLKSLKPLEIEGPYEKCKDYRLRGDPKEYYTLLVQIHAKIAGRWKAGTLCSKGVMKSLLNAYVNLDPGNPKAWGMDPEKATGDDPSQALKKIEFACNFVSETAKQIFPAYVTDEAFKKKFINTLMTFNAYTKELDFFKSHLLDYLSPGHANLNADNAYFWRDDNGILDCGVFDFGGFGTRSVGHMIWWTFNCADFDNFQEHLPHYIEAFIDSYQSNGGPRLDKDLLKQMICFTALENMIYMVAAVPNCLKMCPTAEWATIADRHDLRIAGNITGKSTLRTTLQVMGNCIRLIEEMEVDAMLQRWIEKFFVGEWKQVAKSDAVIFGR